MMPSNVQFAYGIWQLWLSRNNRIFNPPFETVNQLMHKTLHLAAKFYHLTYSRKTKGTKVTKIISWRPPQTLFVTLIITLVKQEMEMYLETAREDG